MNYLAHTLLAEPYAHSLIGNLAGDLVKGPLGGQALHPRVADGIRRHRRVDTLTDTHPEYLSLRQLFPAPERRFAGIVLDVVFDYFLCRHWSRFTRWERGEFISGVYQVLSSRRACLPQPLAERAAQWVQADWLRVYESMQGICAVLQRLSDRLASNTGRHIDLPGLLEDVWTQESRLEQGFLAVFGDVQKVVDGFGFGFGSGFGSGSGSGSGGAGYAAWGASDAAPAYPSATLKQTASNRRARL